MPSRARMPRPLTFAVLLMLGASLGDRFGRRRLFVIGLAIFTAASSVYASSVYAAALAPGMGELIAARAAPGVGAAIVTPLTLTLLSAAVPAERRGAAGGISETAFRGCLTAGQ